MMPALTFSAVFKGVHLFVPQAYIYGRHFCIKIVKSGPVTDLHSVSSWSSFNTEFECLMALSVEHLGLCCVIR